MAEKTFTFDAPVSVGGKSFKQVTMRHFKGRDLMAFTARREDLATAGEEAQYIMCEMASDAPAELFKEMPLVTYANILAFMAPAFEALQDLVGNGKKTEA